LELKKAFTKKFNREETKMLHGEKEITPLTVLKLGLNRGIKLGYRKLELVVHMGSSWFQI
jgi:hypothetical protein